MFDWFQCQTLGVFPVERITARRYRLVLGPGTRLEILHMRHENKDILIEVDVEIVK